VTALLGSTVLLGWVFDRPALAALGFEARPVRMAPAALALALGLAMVLDAPRAAPVVARHVVARLYGLIALLAILLTLGRAAGGHIGLVSLGEGAPGEPLHPLAPLVPLAIAGASATLRLLSLDDSRAAWRVRLGWFVGGSQIMAALPLLLSASTAGSPFTDGSTTTFTPAVCLLVVLTGAGVLASTSVRQRAEGPREASGPGLARFVVAFLAVAAAAEVIGLAYFLEFQRGLRRDLQQQLESVATLQVEWLTQWRRERLGDARVLFNNPMMRAMLHNTAGDAETSTTSAEATAWLSTYDAYAQYDRIFLLAADGEAILRHPATAEMPDAEIARKVSSVGASSVPAIIDIESGPVERREARLAVVMPVFAPDTMPPALQGFGLLRIDPKAQLYPFLRRWPGPGTTSDSHVVRREREIVHFINPVHGADSPAPGHAEVPLTNRTVVAVQAALGRTGPVLGEDTDGRAVFGTLTPVPDSTWVLVTHMDVAEFQEMLADRTLVIAAFVALLVIVAGTALLLAWRTSRARQDRRRAEVVDALQTTTAALDQLLARSPTVIYTMLEVDGRLRPVSMSRNVERLFGFTVDEALAPDWWPRHIDPADIPVAMDALRRLATDDTIESVYRFRRKDGSVLWVSDRLEVSRRVDGHAVEATGALNDVTARHATERSLWESEERLRLALMASEQGLFDFDVPTGRVVVNDDYARMLGHDPSTFRESFEGWRGRLHPEDRERAEATLAGFLAGGAADLYTSEFRMQTRVGEWRWILSTGRLTARGADGAPRRMLGTHTDVTARKVAEARAQRLAQLYAALSHSNEAIVRCAAREDLFPRICEIVVQHGGIAMAWIGLVDPQTRRVRPVAAAGARPGDVEYLDGLEISTDPSTAAGNGATGRAIREDQAIWVTDFGADPATAPWRARAAEHGWVASASLPLRLEGRPIGALSLYGRAAATFDDDGRRLLTALADDLGFALDAMARDERRRAAEAALRIKDLAIEASHNAIGVADLAGRLTYVNRAFLRDWGYQDVHEVLGRTVDTFCATPEHAAPILAALAAEGMWAGELEARTGTGADLVMLATMSRIDDETGAPVCLLATFSDITRRRRAEAEVRAALREREALLKEIHHRVKNNLQVITSLLRLESNRAPQADVKRVLVEMKNRVISMALLHELLYRSDTLAQVDLGGYLAELGRQVFDTAALQAGVLLDARTEPVALELDQAVPCGLLVNELLSNALKHGFPAGRRGKVHLTLRRLDDAGRVLVEVHDDGVGLPADFAQRSKGSLGLQIVSDLTRQLDGHLEVDSPDGARFRVTFTVKVSAGVPPTAARESAPSSRPPLVSARPRVDSE
jgi:PAS domain S-box-containing protein